jgi:hypothetical protein
VSNDRFLELFAGSGGTHDAARVFWGDTTVADQKTSAGFVAIVVSGTTYYMKVFTGGSTVQCSTNYVGNYLTVGTFTIVGHVPVLVNNTNVRYVAVYSYTP